MSSWLPFGHRMVTMEGVEGWLWGAPLVIRTLGLALLGLTNLKKYCSSEEWVRGRKGRVFIPSLLPIRKAKSSSDSSSRNLKPGD